MSKKTETRINRAKQMAEYHKLRVRMAEATVEGERRRGEMPEWTHESRIDTRIPVSLKVEHDGLEVESWTSKRGAKMHRVHWADGTTTQYEGNLSKSYVEWDR